MQSASLRTPAGFRPLEGKVSFLKSNVDASSGHGINTYERVNLGEMYPGINVQLRATGSNVEKIFTVAPDRDPKQIQVKVSGALALNLGEHGELVASTGNGPVAFTAPIAYQETAAGERRPVPVAYVLNAATSSYGFTLGDYDRNQPLVIDPLLARTYVGGSGGDWAMAIATHPITGDVYVAGGTQSSNFPGVVGGAQSGYAGVSAFDSDAFVTRFDSTLTTRLQSTYFGGGSSEGAVGIAIHPASGEVYIIGGTASTDLPGVAGGAQPSFGGTPNVADGFIARFNSSLTALMQASYIAGPRYDIVSALAIHPNTGDVFVAGWTQWTAWDDPIATSTSAQSAYGGGNSDAFVLRFNAALSARTASTYLGGSGEEGPPSLAIHPTNGDIYVAVGGTSIDVPGTTGGAQSAPGNGSDGFIARLNPALSALIQTTYVGANPSALAIHRTTGEVYVAGQTPASTLPGATGGAQGTYAGGSSDVFVMRFGPALTTRLQATYLGGTGWDTAKAMVIHPGTGDVYIAGNTSSVDLPAVAGGVQSATTINSSTIAGDGFVARLNAALTTLSQSTYLGRQDFGQDVALAVGANNGSLYVAGDISGPWADLPCGVVVADGAQQVAGSYSDAFAMRVSPDLRAASGPGCVAAVPETAQPVPALAARSLMLLMCALLSVAFVATRLFGSRRVLQRSKIANRAANP